MIISFSSHSELPEDIFIRRRKIPNLSLAFAFSFQPGTNQRTDMWSIAIVLLLASSSLAIELPSQFRICNRTKPETEYYQCVADSARDAVVSLAGGLKPFKILPVEPLAVDSIKIGESEGSVTLKQEYKNIKIYGLTKGLEITNYNIDFDKLILTSNSFNPQVNFVANYKIDGRILLLPVRGSGKSNITMYNLKTRNEIFGERYQKNGETHMRITKYIVKFTPEKVTLKFDNLFNGDTILGEQMNRFINENSDLLFKELQEPYEETFGLVFAKIANDIFSRIPLDKIFPQP